MLPQTLRGPPHHRRSKPWRLMSRPSEWWPISRKARPEGAADPQDSQGGGPSAAESHPGSVYAPPGPAVTGTSGAVCAFGRLEDCGGDVPWPHGPIRCGQWGAPQATAEWITALIPAAPNDKGFRGCGSDTHLLAGIDFIILERGPPNGQSSPSPGRPGTNSFLVAFRVDPEATIANLTFPREGGYIQRVTDPTFPATLNRVLSYCAGSSTARQLQHSAPWGRDADIISHLKGDMNPAYRDVLISSQEDAQRHCDGEWWTRPWTPLGWCHVLFEAVQRNCVTLGLMHYMVLAVVWLGGWEGRPYPKHVQAIYPLPLHFLEDARKAGDPRYVKNNLMLVHTVGGMRWDKAKGDYDHLRALVVVLRLNEDLVLPSYFDSALYARGQAHPLSLRPTFSLAEVVRAHYVGSCTDDSPLGDAEWMLELSELTAVNTDLFEPGFLGEDETWDPSPMDTGYHDNRLEACCFFCKRSAVGGSWGSVLGHRSTAS